MNAPARLVLASSSVYRRELLSRFGLPFIVASPDVDERPIAGERPAEMVLRLAQAKAQAVAQQYPQALVIGSDQAATLDGEHAIGKPGTYRHAFEQLRAASGREMTFHTAVTVIGLAAGFSEHARIDTCVRFRHLEDSEIDHYLRREQPYDCAGSAKVEGLGIVLLEAIAGDDPTALIGLPLIALAGMLRRAGMSPLGAPAASAAPSASAGGALSTDPSTSAASSAPPAAS